MATQILGNLLLGFIVILVGLALVPTVQDFVTSAQGTANISTTNSSLVGLIMTFFHRKLNL